MAIVPLKDWLDYLETLPKGGQVDQSDVNFTALEADIDPHPDRGDWIDFLYWMDDYKTGLDSRAIIRIVESPHRYGSEYAEYIASGGVNRLD